MNDKQKRLLEFYTDYDTVIRHDDFQITIKEVREVCKKLDKDYNTLKF